MNDDDAIAGLLYGYAMSARPAVATPTVIPVAAPGAGLDWSVTVPNGVLWVPISVYYTFASSAVVATRASSLAIGVGGTRIARLGPLAGQAAGGGFNYTWARGYVQSGNVSGASNGNALPAIPVPTGATIGTVTANMDVGDAYSAIALYVLAFSPWDRSDLEAYVAELKAGSPRWDNFPGVTQGL